MLDGAGSFAVSPSVLLDVPVVTSTSASNSQGSPSRLTTVPFGNTSLSIRSSFFCATICTSDTVHQIRAMRFLAGLIAFSISYENRVSFRQGLSKASFSQSSLKVRWPSSMLLFYHDGISIQFWSGFIEDEDGEIIDEGDPVMVCKHCDAVREITDDDEL